MTARHQANGAIERLRENLQGLKGRKGIIGYILRGSDAASIDLKDSSKIVDYAVLSATALEEGAKVAKTCGIGAVSSSVLEGENMKILLVTVDDHRLSVFMKKTVDHNRLCAELNLA